MLTLKRYLDRNNQRPINIFETKAAVFTFGRFNPPTRGHKKLVKKVSLVAEERRADMFIFPSQTHDKRKNPLPWDVKLVFLRMLFPEANIMAEKEVKSPFHATAWLTERGYTDIYLVAGSDRVVEYQERFSKPEEYFNLFEVVNAGVRDPDADDVSGMSASKAREAAIVGDVGGFRAATGWDGDISEKLMSAVRMGLGITE